MSAEVELISSATEKMPWTRPPIQMEFQVRLKSIIAFSPDTTVAFQILSKIQAK